jgi:hypothetical protein
LLCGNHLGGSLLKINGRDARRCHHRQPVRVGRRHPGRSPHSRRGCHDGKTAIARIDRRGAGVGEPGATGARLGVDSCLYSAPPGRDREDLMYLLYT